MADSIGAPQKLRVVSASCGAGLVATALLILPGWGFAGAGRGRVSLAVGFLVAGVSILTLGRPATARLGAMAGSPALVLLGLVSLKEGGMAAASAASFVVAGATLLLTAVPSAVLAAQVVSLAAGVASVAAYAYQLETSAAPAVTVGFLLFYAGVFFSRPDRGLVRLLAMDSVGGALARRLIPPVIVLPLLLGWARLAGQRWGVFGLETGLWLLVSSNAVLLTVLIWWSCRSLQRLDEAHGRTESALRRWEQIVQHAGWGVAIVDAVDDTLQAVNPAFAAMHGFTTEELLGKSLVEILAPESRSELPVRLLHLRSNVSYEAIHLRKDGSRFPVLTAMTAVKSAGGRVLYRAANFQDITDRKRAEDQFRGLLASAPDAMVIANQEGRIVLVNHQTEKLFGYSTQQLLGQSVEELLPERLRMHFLLLRSEYLKNPRARKVEAGLGLVGRRRDGSEFPMEVSLSPLVTEGDSLVISAVRDITERRQAEAALRELSGRLLQLQDEERRRIARELHDTTAQNLAALEMNLAILGRSTSQWEPAAREALTDSAELAAQSLREIRSLSYLLHPPLLEELGLASALRAYVDGYSQRASLQVELEVASDLGRLSREAEITLFRIVQEALNNIRRHSGSPTAVIRLKRGRGEVLLEISDQGRGIPQEILEHNADGVARLGVGILGMRERARQLGGRLEVHSNGQGTTVTTVLPLGAAAHA